MDFEIIKITQVHEYFMVVLNIDVYHVRLVNNM